MNRRYHISCNNIITEKIIVYNYGGNYKAKQLFIFIVGHLGIFTYVNYILISFNYTHTHTTMIYTPICSGSDNVNFYISMMNSFYNTVHYV